MLRLEGPIGQVVRDIHRRDVGSAAGGVAAAAGVIVVAVAVTMVAVTSASGEHALEGALVVSSTALRQERGVL